MDAVIQLDDPEKCGSGIRSLGPVYHPSRASPLPSGALWPSRIGTAWASTLPSLPAADTRVTR